MVQNKGITVLVSALFSALAFFFNLAFYVLAFFGNKSATPFDAEV